VGIQTEGFRGIQESAPVSRILYNPFEGVLTIIPLGQPLLTGSSHLPARPGSTGEKLPLSEQALHACLFGVAPSGVYLASLVAKSAGVSYTTGSPLPVHHPKMSHRRYVFCCTFRRLGPSCLNL
jgi:hypothetical protein